MNISKKDLILSPRKESFYTRIFGLFAPFTKMSDPFCIYYDFMLCNDDIREHNNQELFTAHKVDLEA